LLQKEHIELNCVHGITIFAFKNSVIRAPVLTKKRTLKVYVASCTLKPLLTTERKSILIIEHIELNCVHGIPIFAFKNSVIRAPVLEGTH